VADPICHAGDLRGHTKKVAFQRPSRVVSRNVTRQCVVLARSAIPCVAESREADQHHKHLMGLSELGDLLARSIGRAIKWLGTRPVIGRNKSEPSRLN
jgi:hypothetical protein